MLKSTSCLRLWSFLAAAQCAEKPWTLPLLLLLVVGVGLVVRLSGWFIRKSC
jgi:hypothetical protein